MKKILIAFLMFAFLGGTACLAQKHTFTVKCGKQESKIQFNEEVGRTSYFLQIVIGSKDASHLMDSHMQTTSWHVVDPGEDSDFTIVLKDGWFVYSGKFKGKTLDKKVKSEGLPWYQHIGYVAGHVLKENEKVKFVCVRPTDLKIFPMTAEISGPEAIGCYKDAICTKVLPAGALARFWSSYYYFDPVKRNFVGYHAVEGGPGTPESFWILDK